jgi:integrase
MDKVERRIELHLTPFFEGRKMASIRGNDIAAYTHQRLQEGAKHATINRELTFLKRMFCLALEDELLLRRPNIKRLREDNVRTAFFEDHQVTSVLRHLPDAIRPAVEFAWRTGRPINSEVLPLEWRRVDPNANEIRLDPGATKNREGRVIRLSAELRTLLETQRAEHERLKQAGHIFRYVSFREVAKGRGGKKYPKRITTFNKAWKNACKAAGCPGMIPHDLRRTAVRNYIRAGIPQAVAMQLTGHRTYAVFHRYNIVSEGDLLDAAQRMSGGHVVSR